MISFRVLIFIVGVILCHFLSKISGHAYFSYPTPRNVYCTNSSCTSDGVLGAQGPVWSLPANSSLITQSLTSETTCNGSTVLVNASLGNTYDPGFQGTTVVSWTAGSTQTFQIFISEIHSPENQTIYPTDGWQIRYRDGTQSGSTFTPIAFTYVNVSTVASTGPLPAIGFQLGQTILATITVPSGATSDGIFQFFWRNNEVGTGAMWLSCVDVAITAYSTILVPSTFSVILIGLLVALRATLNI